MKLNDNTAIVVLHCPDRPGILSAVTEFINKNKGNILYLDQYVNREEGVFFMRIKWDLTLFTVAKENIENEFRTVLADRFGMTYRLYFSDVKPRMAIFVSKM
ncbi:MAG: ACT domain-containing protein, partial [Bacteroidales bacterium]|nr:ACT domain-containing protein [Bacteroidales bacterium]